MRIIQPSVELVDKYDYIDVLTKLVNISSVCYKSEKDRSENEMKSYIQKRIDTKHESILEHVSFTVKFVVDRGVTHELVRHRLASFSQESTRYCNYSGDKFDNQLTFIEPFFYQGENKAVEYSYWLQSMSEIEKNYMKLLEEGSQPQEARSILPNSLKSELYMTANLREWRYVLKLRTAPNCHPQMLQVMKPLFNLFSSAYPILFYYNDEKKEFSSLIEILRNCSQKFIDYANEHAEKGNEVNARKNLEMSEKCDIVLKQMETL